MPNTLRTEPNVRCRPSRRTTPNKQIGRTLPRKRAEPDGTFRNLKVRELKPSERVRNQSGQTTGKRQKPKRSENRKGAQTRAVSQPGSDRKRARQKQGRDIGFMTFPSRHTSM